MVLGMTKLAVVDENFLQRNRSVHVKRQARGGPSWARQQQPSHQKLFNKNK
jgi:hypothetical protein